MSDDKIKAIGQITLANSSILGGLASCVTSTIEKILPFVPDQKGMKALLHDLEQIQGLLRDLQPTLDRARSELEED